eukprot:m.178993 g.178993  ORF g.178993 m.178993 type:complete len:320 (+) comp31954_c3_seq2:294-1253(+)
MSDIGAHGILLDEHGRRNVEAPNLYETDKDTLNRIRKVTAGLSSTLHELANEPSLGLFRMQEHVRRTVPELVETKRSLKHITQTIQGTCHDIEYALNSVQAMHSITSLARLQAYTVKAIEYQQMIKRQRNVDLADLTNLTSGGTPNTGGAFASHMNTGAPTGRDENGQEVDDPFSGTIPTDSHSMTHQGKQSTQVLMDEIDAMPTQKVSVATSGVEVDVVVDNSNSDEAEIKESDHNDKGKADVDIDNNDNTATTANVDTDGVGGVHVDTDNVDDVDVDDVVVVVSIVGGDLSNRSALLIGVTTSRTISSLRSSRHWSL